MSKSTLHKLVFALCLLVAPVFAQVPCSTITPVTPNLGLNIPAYLTPGGPTSPSWNVLYNTNLMCLDSYLSGNTPLSKLSVNVYFNVLETAQPANPPAGWERWYANSTTHQLSCITSAGANCAPVGGGGGGTWGSITGTLSNQTDLQTALNLLAPKASPTLTGTVTVNGLAVDAPSGVGVARTITGDASSSDILDLFTNTNGYGAGGYLKVKQLTPYIVQLYGYSGYSQQSVTLSSNGVTLTDSSGNQATMSPGGFYYAPLGVSCAVGSYLLANGGCATPSFSSGLSGMVGGQVAIAGTSSTITSSMGLSGSNGYIPTSPNLLGVAGGTLVCVDGSGGINVCSGTTTSGGSGGLLWSFNPLTSPPSGPLGSLGAATYVYNGVFSCILAGGASCMPGASGTLGLASTPAALTIGYLNNGTGTTNGKIAALVSGSQDTIQTTGATATNVIGIVVSGGGTTGTAQVAVDGTAACTFSNTAVVGDFVQAYSAGNGSYNGQCVDAGSTYPASGSMIVGTVADGGAAGSHNVHIWIANPSVGAVASVQGLTGAVVIEAATAGQVAISGGNASALTGASDLTYSGHTFSAISTTIFDLSAATGTAAFKVPANSSNTATAAGVLDFDTTNKDYHGYVNGSDSKFAVYPTTLTPVATQCATWVAAGSAWTLGSAACGSGGGGSITGFGTLVAYDVYYMPAGGSLATAKADGSINLATNPAICVAYSTTVCSTAGGTVTYASWTWTVGGAIYVSDATTGLMTQTAPSTSGHYVQRIGVALSATVMLVEPGEVLTIQ